MSFPLSQHPNSMPAAQAALLARDKGKFWPVHDALFENQGHLSSEVLQEILGKAGIPAADWKKALADKRFQEEAETQRAAGVAAGVNATPTVFVNGRKLDLVPAPRDPRHHRRRRARLAEDTRHLDHGQPVRLGRRP